MGVLRAVYLQPLLSKEVYPLRGERIRGPVSVIAPGETGLRTEGAGEIGSTSVGPPSSSMFGRLPMQQYTLSAGAGKVVEVCFKLVP